MGVISANPRERLRFVVALLDETQEFQRFQGDDARATAAELDVDVDVLFAENTAVLQIQQLYGVLRRSLEARPHAILVETVTGEGLERVAQAAVRSGVGWVLINREAPYIHKLRAEYPAVPIAGITTDQLMIGRVQGGQILELLPHGEGKVLYLQGPCDTSAAQERLQGTQDALGGAGVDLKVLEGRWTEVSGRQAVERWLRLKNHQWRPDIVACQNDHMAMGARRALNAYPGVDLSAVPVVGVDGLAEGGQRLVRSGRLAATVTVPSNTGPALHVLTQCFRGLDLLPPQVVLSPAGYPSVITWPYVAGRSSSSAG